MLLLYLMTSAIRNYKFIKTKSPSFPLTIVLRFFNNFCCLFLLPIASRGRNCSPFAGGAVALAAEGVSDERFYMGVEPLDRGSRRDPLRHCVPPLPCRERTSPGCGAGWWNKERTSPQLMLLPAPAKGCGSRCPALVFLMLLR